MIDLTKNKLYEIAMPRKMLTDELWSKLKAIFLEDREYKKSEHRQPMNRYLTTLFAKHRGIAFIGSTKIAICHIIRAKRNKFFKGNC